MPAPPAVPSVRSQKSLLGAEALVSFMSPELKPMAAPPVPLTPPQLKRSSSSGSLPNSKRICTPPPPQLNLPPQDVAAAAAYGLLKAEKKPPLPVASASFAPFGAAVVPAPPSPPKADGQTLRDKHHQWQAKLAAALRDASPATRALVGNALHLPPLGAAVSLCRLHENQVQQLEPAVLKIVVELRERAVKLLWHNPRLKDALHRLPPTELRKMGLAPLVASAAAAAS